MIDLSAAYNQLRRDYVKVADAILRDSSGPDDLVSEVLRLRGEVARLKERDEKRKALIQSLMSSIYDARVAGDALERAAEAGDL